MDKALSGAAEERVEARESTRQQAFLRERQWPKRVLDLTLTFVGAIFILPLLAILALWIRMDSPGPVFYAQQRIGQDGKDFQAWKFRSMVHDADECLQRCLDVFRGLAKDDHRRAMIDGAIPDLAGCFIPFVAGQDDIAVLTEPVE